MVHLVAEPHHVDTRTLNKADPDVAPRRRECSAYGAVDVYAPISNTRARSRKVLFASRTVLKNPTGSGCLIALPGAGGGP
jgi:hypothetical protein